MPTSAVELPGGTFAMDGTLVTQAEIRPLNGDDERWLADRPREAPTAVVVTGLLARTLVRLGWEASPGPGAVRRLLIADRDYLLLSLRRETFGSHVEAGLACPACDAVMDLDFDTEDVPVERRPHTTESLQTTVVTAGGRSLTIGFRLPTGADQEALLSLPGADGEVLLARCVDSIDGTPTAPSGLSLLDDTARAELEAAMKARAPSAELAMDIVCPECEQASTLDLDLAQFLLEEMWHSARHLVSEVHALAYHYHWTERDILALPRERRRAYLELIASERAREPW